MNQSQEVAAVIFARSSRCLSSSQTVLGHIRMENNLLSLSKSLVLRIKVVGGESQTVKPLNLLRKL